MVAVNQSSHVPTVVASSTEDPIKSSEPQSITFTITSLPKVRALAPGNRVVLTATQHEPTISLLTPRTFVTVHQLQAGPSRGPVGRLDCSDRPLQAGGSGGVPNFDNCDFTGAVLKFALLSAVGSPTNYWQADFSAADLRNAGLDQAALWSAWLPGADLTGAALHNVTLFNVFAPVLTVVKTGIAGSNSSTRISPRRISRVRRSPGPPLDRRSLCRRRSSMQRSRILSIWPLAIRRAQTYVTLSC